MRKVVVLVMVICLLSGLMSAARADEPEGIQPGTAITIGTDVPIGGHFATEIFSNNASDMDVRMLLHGYSTVVWASDTVMEINETVVSDVRRTESNGRYTFELEIREGLTYCDGTEITAKDYLFTLLLLGSTEARQIGATPQGFEHIQGYSAYQEGFAPEIAGARLLSERRFSIELHEKYVPYFYNLAAISLRPCPIDIIAPGCDVRDDGKGIYIAGEFSVEQMAETMLDPKTGYLYMPRVTSGPYMLESVDVQRATASFVANPYFKGDPMGKKPHIERITLVHMPEEDAVEALRNGEIDMQVRAMESGTIAGAQAQIDAGLPLRMASYPRTGFAFLAFSCELGATQSVAVRHAVAMCLDKDAVVDILPDTAARVYGFYGMGQWMATYADEGGEDTPALDAAAELKKLDIPYDMEGAIARLEADGWQLDANGGAYAGSGVRYAMRDGVLRPLTLRWAVVEGDATAQAVREQLEKNLPQAGFDLIVEEISFPDLLEHYYRRTGRRYNMFSLASNFTYIFDPYYTFHTGSAYQGQVNTSGLRDNALMLAAELLQRTEPGQIRAYEERWLAFQARFAEVLPLVPLYSNLYHDVLRTSIEGYDVNGTTGWATGIARAWIAQ